MEELIIKNDSTKNNDVDAVTAATKPALKDYLVKNAAYTCYTLWHTVYGPTRSKILSILKQRADPDYLKNIFKSGKPNYLLWAIEFVDKHPQYQVLFLDSIINQLESENDLVSKKTFDYFNLSRLANQKTQEKLAKRFAFLNRNLRNELISRFSELNYIGNNSFFILIEQYENGQINAGDLRKICELIQPEDRDDSRLIQKMESLSKDRNPFVRRISQKFVK